MAANNPFGMSSEVLEGPSHGNGSEQTVPHGSGALPVQGDDATGGGEVRRAVRAKRSVDGSTTEVPSTGDTTFAAPPGFLGEQPRMPTMEELRRFWEMFAGGFNQSFNPRYSAGKGGSVLDEKYFRHITPFKGDASSLRQFQTDLLLSLIHI